MLGKLHPKSMDEMLGSAVYIGAVPVTGLSCTFWLLHCSVLVLAGIQFIFSW